MTGLQAVWVGLLRVPQSLVHDFPPPLSLLPQLVSEQISTQEHDYGGAGSVQRPISSTIFIAEMTKASRNKFLSFSLVHFPQVANVPAHVQHNCIQF